MTRDRRQYISANPCLRDSSSGNYGDRPGLSEDARPILSPRFYFDTSAGNFEKIIFGTGENSYHVEIRLEDMKDVISYELADVAGELLE